MTRRDLLQSSAAVVAAGLPFQSDRKLKLVFTGGHPGDPEYGCGGTIARCADAGHACVLLYLNEGEPHGGPAGAPRGRRVAEAKKACAILGAEPRFAGQIDGDAIVDRTHYETFRRLIEAERPHAVFTHWPIDNHADHRAIASLVHDAWIKLKRSFALYYYEVSNGEDTLMFYPTHYVDIADLEARKRAACFAHGSQAPERFYALQDRIVQMRGIERGCLRAEGLIRNVQSPGIGIDGL